MKTRSLINLRRRVVKNKFKFCLRYISLRITIRCFYHHDNKIYTLWFEYKIMIQHFSKIDFINSILSCVKLGLVFYYIKKLAKIRLLDFRHANIFSCQYSRWYSLWIICQKKDTKFEFTFEDVVRFNKMIRHLIIDIGVMSRESSLCRNSFIASLSSNFLHKQLDCWKFYEDKELNK